MSAAGRGARRIVTAVLTLVVVFNVYAFLHARMMTHVVADEPVSVAMIQPAAAGRLTSMLLAGASARPVNRATPRDRGLSYTVQTIPLADGETLESWYIPHPRARGLVLMFHGFAASKESLLPPAVELHRLGLATLLVDFRGAGGSSGSTTTLGIREADDVAATVTYAQATWPAVRLVLYGVSMGSAAVLRASAVHGVTPAALILESPFDRLLTTVRRRFAAVLAPSTPAAEAVLFWGGLQLGVDPFTHNPIDDAHAVTAPTLILHGDRDPWLSLPEASGIASTIRAPARLVAITNAGHDALAVVAPAEWRTAVADFMDQCLGEA